MHRTFVQSSRPLYSHLSSTKSADYMHSNNMRLAFRQVRLEKQSSLVFLHKLFNMRSFKKALSSTLNCIMLIFMIMAHKLNNASIVISENIYSLHVKRQQDAAYVQIQIRP